MDKYLDKTGLQRVIEHLKSKFLSYVPVTRKVNDHPLASDINLTARDVGAASEDWVEMQIQDAIFDSWTTAI